MVIGFVQYSPIFGDIQRTLSTLERLSVGFSGADLLVLPELCSTGYNFLSDKQAQELSEPVDDSVLLRFLAGLCSKNKQYIVAGFNEREGNHLYNSAALVGPSGLIGVYRKIHLFQNEKDCFLPGDKGLPVFEIGKARIGILICFDWIFPEVWRILALKGADIICHPSNLVLPWLAQRGVPAHALMNRVFTITANRTGTERDLTFTGRSIICDTAGLVVASATGDEECVRMIEIDVAAARNKSVTSRNDIFADRRPDQYRLLCEPPKSGNR
ncbi:carbon-nitrogen hydrolase [candidate division GN15 bacterium]|uniref:Carbon-nitrogen hydrolase n=1 Tax=candidate division GN15 bacterium TaxID=2072418 RepID=A0A855X4I4_9BACT|nr:MAG: carbon-nitrogen hydrolase [candidate division GN15 bacterium]